MVINTVSEILSLINEQIEFQEELYEYLLKADALSTIALSEGFLDYKKSIINNYLWAMSSIIMKAINLNEKSFNKLLIGKKAFFSSHLDLSTVAACLCMIDFPACCGVFRKAYPTHKTAAVVFISGFF